MKTNRRRISQSGNAGTRSPHSRRPARHRRLFWSKALQDHVYWVERTGKTAQFLSLNAAPIDIAPVLRRMLFRDGLFLRHDQCDACCGTSGSFLFSRTHRRRRSRTDCSWEVPSIFAKQMKLFVVQKMPDPRDDGYDEALAEWIAHFVEETDGRAFVLFTSYRGMQQLAQEMGSFFATNENESARAGTGRCRAANCSNNSRARRAASFSGPIVFGWAWMCRATRSRMSSSHGCPSRCRIIH